MKGSGRQRRGGASGVATVSSPTMRIAAKLIKNRPAKWSLLGEGDIARKGAVTLPKLKFMRDDEEKR